jgi:hypothetical protein
MDLTDPQHWKARAAEAQRGADDTTDAEQKKSLLEIVALCEEVADRFEQLKRK